MSDSKIIELFKKYDFSFFAMMGGIFLIGIINLYSATHSTYDPLTDKLYRVQIGWFFFSVGVGVVVSFISPKTIFQSSYLIYVVNVFLLVLVLFLGRTGMGATRWLSFGPIGFQPSEFMKVAVILGLARWMINISSEKELGIKELIIPFIIAFVPAVLTIVQPDLGTGILILLIFFSMSFFRRIKWKTLFIIIGLAIVSGTLLYQFGLREYQKKRIHTFIDPDSDSRGAGYNAIQSKIAIGSGQFIGKGFKQSSQASLSYLPENHTDFIFSIYNEEHGFVGALVLIALFLVLFFRFIWLATSVNSLFESLVVMGLMSIFFWHTFINMSMVMGLMPVVGVPLPLMSYGGSSLLTFGICCGLATSMSNSRNIF